MIFCFCLCNYIYFYFLFVVWKLFFRLVIKFLLFLILVEICSSVLEILVVVCVFGVMFVCVMVVVWEIKFFIFFNDFVSVNNDSLFRKWCSVCLLLFSLKFNIVLKFFCWCVVILCFWFFGSDGWYSFFINGWVCRYFIIVCVLCCVSFICGISVCNLCSSR